jgi:serine/threonine protein kinase
MESLTAADPRVIGEFRLRARLGAGGMGQVFLATSPGGRMVAVKVIRAELARDEEFVRRFRAEVDAARRVSGLYTAPSSRSASMTDHRGSPPPSSPARHSRAMSASTARCRFPRSGGWPPGWPTHCARYTPPGSCTAT